MNDGDESNPISKSSPISATAFSIICIVYWIITYLTGIFSEITYFSIFFGIANQLIVRSVGVIWSGNIAKKKERYVNGWRILGFWFPLISLIVIDNIRKLEPADASSIKRDKRITKLTGTISSILILGSPLVLWIIFNVVMRPEPPQRLKEFYQVPFFLLATQNGDSLSSDDLKGYAYVTDFFFTSCNGVCPKMNSNLSGLQNAFKDEERIKFLSITVDPEQDSIPVLKQYAEKYKAIDRKWYFLTGKKNIIYQLAEGGFKVPVADTSNGTESFTHSDRLVLVDGTGMIRGYYKTVEDSTAMDSLYNDITNLLLEKPKTSEE